jgi:hypothetical protein
MQDVSPMPFYERWHYYDHVIDNSNNYFIDDGIDHIGNECANKLLY